MKRIANFLFEIGMLKRTPRSGFQFLGSGRESVAEHAFRVACIGYALAQIDPDVDEGRLIKLCLLHDVPEARTGDLNYMNKKYVSVDEDRAVADLAETLPFGDNYRDAIAEFNAAVSPEARLANDADQLDLILMLKEAKDLGNRYAEDWLGFALRRLKTAAARQLADEILSTDWSEWWFSDRGDWWVSGGNPRLE